MDADGPPSDGPDVEGLAQLGEYGLILGLGPPMDEQTRQMCTRLLTLVPPAEARVVTVDFHRKPRQVLDRWIEQVGEVPAQLSIVVVDEYQQSDLDHPDADRVTVESINANDLTGLSIKLTEAITSPGAELTTLVCFNSLTALLMYAERQIVFRFVRSIAGLAAREGATVHVHMDPDAHDLQTVNTFKAAAGGLIEVFDSGLVVRHR